MDILVTNQNNFQIILQQIAFFSCRPEAQKSKSAAATTLALPKLNPDYEWVILQSSVISFKDGDLKII